MCSMVGGDGDTLEAGMGECHLGSTASALGAGRRGGTTERLPIASADDVLRRRSAPALGERDLDLLEPRAGQRETGREQ